MEWFRWWHGTLTDPKFQWVTRKSGQNFASVIALWVALLERASNVTQCDASDSSQKRGDVTGFDCDDHDVLFGLEDGSCALIYEAFVAKGMIAEDAITSWDKRQPKREDSSAARTRAYRGRQAKESSVTTGDAHVTHGDDKSREEKKREDKKEPKSKADARASRLPKDWEPSDIDMAFIRKERPDLDAANVANQFRDYWIAKAGKDGAKADWPATWRNWVRNQRQQYGGGGGQTNFNEDRKRVMDELTGRGRHAAIDDINIIDI